MVTSDGQGSNDEETRVSQTGFGPVFPFEGAATAYQPWAIYNGANVKLPAVTIASAMMVPAFSAAVMFLSRTLANLDFVALRDTADGPQPIGGKLGTIIRDAPNPQWSGFAARTYFWQQVFTVGRGLFIIVRDDRGQPDQLWPVNPAIYKLRLDTFGRKTYIESHTGRVFQAEDVIDVPFFLLPDQVSVQSPVDQGKDAIQLALAMAKFGSTFFAGGGMPPLSVEGPMPASPDARNRAMSEINRSIEESKGSDRPIFAMPPGFTLKEVGFEPSKAEMTDSRRFQIEEIARVFQIPPMFLQDLTRATFNNSEAQDLFLVKHLLTQWTKALEDECNLKLFGQLKNRRYVRHNFDSLLRGDFLTRMEGLTASVQGGIRTPNEARVSEGLPAHADPAANQLFMQGATVPIDQAQKLTDDNATTENNDQAS